MFNDNTTATPCTKLNQSVMCRVSCVPTYIGVSLTQLQRASRLTQIPDHQTCVLRDESAGTPYVRNTDEHVGTRVERDISIRHVVSR